MGEVFWPPPKYLRNMYEYILVDGKNIANRAVAAALSSKKRGKEDVHPITIMIRMMDRWRRLFKPRSWHVFWDVPKTNLWRKDFYPEYKEGRPSFDEERATLLKETQRAAAQLFQNMKITQYIRQKNEADDLIYAFVRLHEDEKTVIVSSDGDITQISYHHHWVDVHNPGKKDTIIDIPSHDPVIVKALAGDKSDNIQNYRLVADKTAMKIIDKGIDDYLDEKGRELFEHNLKLIDLSRNPNLEDNMEYVRGVGWNTNFDFKAIKEMVIGKSISGLQSELVTKIMPFKNI